MQRLSIARLLRLALIGLTVVLAGIAAIGVASLYNARQHYENTLLRSSELSSAAANLATAGVVELEVRRDARGSAAPSARRQAAAGYEIAARKAQALASGDAASRALLTRLLADRYSYASLAAAAKLEKHEVQRQRGARATATTASRHALTLVIAAGAVALIAALTLIALLIRSMREPLDSLVAATQDLAAGAFDRRVEPSGPRELRDLGQAFNAMGADLASATERLEQERRRLATTIESLGDALLVTEPGSSQIATVNPRATQLLPELAPGTEIGASGGPLPPLLALADGEATIEHNGRTLSVTAAALGPGQGAGTVWTVRDITERARLEQAKSDFVATASHELRSPLTSIKGFVELLSSSPGGMSDRQREFVSIILRSTDRLVDLVNDLLDVARLEADHVEINRRPTDPAEIITEVIELMGPAVSGKQQTLTSELHPSLPQALADPGRLRQVIANLVTNAHLYTPPGGRIVVGAAGDGDHVRIWVRDSGIGMTPDQVDRVFDRFYRAVDDRASAGTGLGLSIVKSVVDLHGGTIDVSSERGQGTTFTVSIPAASAAQMAPRALEALRGRHVLVVDDERDIAQLIADQLAPFDVQATIAADGEEALALLAREHFDAITLDIKMPNLDGMTVLTRIRETPGLEMIPVVFVSVFANRQELAGEWLVSKPIDADELRDVLGAAVSTGRTRVLVVARPELQAQVEQSLRSLQIEYQWESNGVAVARACRDRRFEVALVDVGLPTPQAVLQALNLRGRRVRRAIVLFTDGSVPVPAGIERLGLEVVPLEDVAGSLLDGLQPPAKPGAGGGQAADSGAAAR